MRAEFGLDGCYFFAMREYLRLYAYPDLGNLKPTNDGVIDYDATETDCLRVDAPAPSYRIF